jgi:hypothetical protein
MMITKSESPFALLWFVFAFFAIGMGVVIPRLGYAQRTQNVESAMELLKAKAGKLGSAQIRGEESLAGKNVPILSFGGTQINNNFTLVDDLQKEKGCAATFFVRSGEDYVRVATNVKKDDGTRAVGTILDPKGKAIEAIRKGDGYYGDAHILGKAYVTGYEPIRDAKGQVIGIYFVGYPKAPPSK